MSASALLDVLRRAACVALLAALLTGPALAGEPGPVRVDLFHPDGRRQGYAVVDQQTGRVDYYDAQSRRTGWGRVDAMGRAQRFGLDGKRQGETVLPMPPAPKSR